MKQLGILEIKVTITLSLRSTLTMQVVRWRQRNLKKVCCTISVFAYKSSCFFIIFLFPSSVSWQLELTNSTILQNNSPISIYLNCNVTPLSRNFQKRLKHKENHTNIEKMTRKPQSHVRINISIYWMWDILYMRQFDWKRATNTTSSGTDRESLLEDRIFVFHFNFRGCGWNLLVLPFK